MEAYQDLFAKMPLFQGISRKDCESILHCLDGRKRYFQKQEVIWSEGEPARKVGIVLSGCVQVVSEDVFGNRNILEKLMPGELFGAAYACAGVGGSPVSVVAVTDSQVFQVDIQRVLEVCPASCPFHQQLIRNLVTILAGKNVMLGEKLRHLSKRTTREKLLSYLSETAKQKNARHFVIPCNRQELADYLCVERSAMSAELSKLRRDGVLDYRKSEFWLI